MTQKRVDNHGVFNLKRFMFMETAAMRHCKHALFDSQTHNHIHIFGPRRHGKTTLVGELLREADRRKAHCQLNDLRGFDQESKPHHFFRRLVKFMDKDGVTGLHIDPDMSLDGMISTVFDCAEQLHKRTGQKPYIALEECDGLLLDDCPLRDALIQLIDQQHKTGYASPLILSTSSAAPLPWLMADQRDLAHAIAHVRIGRLTADIVPYLAETMPHHFKKDRLQAAKLIFDNTDGHPGLIYELARAASHQGQTAKASVNASIQRRVTMMKSMNRDEPQLETGLDFLTQIPMDKQRLCATIMNHLITQGTFICLNDAQRLAAQQLALTGLVNLSDDDRTIVPLAPIIAYIYADMPERMSDYCAGGTPYAHYRPDSLRFKKLIP